MIVPHDRTTVAGGHVIAMLCRRGRACTYEEGELVRGLIVQQVAGLPTRQVTLAETMQCGQL